jgi:hypothetical protein
MVYCCAANSYLGYATIVARHQQTAETIGNLVFWAAMRNMANIFLRQVHLMVGSRLAYANHIAGVSLITQS